MEDKDKKIIENEKSADTIDEKKPIKPEDRKKIIEKNRFGGYYKTKKRFIN